MRGTASDLGFCVWLTGLPNSGKSTIAHELPALLQSRRMRAVVLDGDVMERQFGTNAAAGPDPSEVLLRRVAYLAELLVKNGLVAIVAMRSPLAATRAVARLRIREFVEVYVTTPDRVCRSRREKGAPIERPGDLSGTVIGATMTFEVPALPDVTVGTLDRTPLQSAEWILRELDRLGWTQTLTSGSSWKYFPPPSFAGPQPPTHEPGSGSESGYGLDPHLQEWRSGTPTPAAGG
jgi:adenylylsulfate kinase-like enzyme